MEVVRAYAIAGRAFQLVNAIEYDDCMQIDCNLNKGLLDFTDMQRQRPHDGFVSSWDEKQGNCKP